MDDQELATLFFRAQADGRKVSRLANGKVVLVELESIDKVGDNEWWLVRLRQKESFAIATPVERVNAPEPRPGLSPAPAPRSVPIQPAPLPPPAAPSTQVQGMSLEPDDLLRSSDRVAIFVDGASTEASSREAGYAIDFRRARDFFLGPGRFHGAFYYAAGGGHQDPAPLRVLDELAYAGFVVRRRPANVVADVVLDMISTSDHYDVAFLLSGAAELERCVEALRARGKRVFVVSSRSLLSRGLAYAADKPVFHLEDHRAVLEREAREHRAPAEPEREPEPEPGREAEEPEAPTPGDG